MEFLCFPQGDIQGAPIVCPIWPLHLSRQNEFLKSWLPADLFLSCFRVQFCSGTQSHSDHAQLTTDLGQHFSRNEQALGNAASLFPHGTIPVSRSTCLIIGWLFLMSNWNTVSRQWRQHKCSVSKMYPGGYILLRTLPPLLQHDFHNQWSSQSDMEDQF